MVQPCIPVKPLQDDSPLLDELGNSCSASDAAVRMRLLTGLKHERERALVLRLPCALAQQLDAMGMDMGRLAMEHTNGFAGHLELSILCFRRSSRVVPPLLMRSMPISTPRRHTMMMLAHYPSHLESGIGHVFSSGHASGPCMALLERVIAHATLSAGRTDMQRLGDILDYLFDAFPAPTDNRLVDGRAFSFKRDFYGQMTRHQQAEWREAVTKNMECHFVDQILEHGRMSGRVLICGKTAHDVMWPIAQEAARRAGQITKTPFELCLPPTLSSPPTGMGAHQLEHLQTALTGFMSLESCIRWDEWLTWFLDVPVNFFAKNNRSVPSALIRSLKRTAAAMAGGYMGDCPTVRELDPHEKEAYEAAIACEYKRRAAKAKHAVAIAGGYRGASTWEGAPLSHVDQEDFDRCLTNERKRVARHGAAKRIYRAAIAGGYSGASPLTGELSEEDELAFDRCLATEMSRRCLQGLHVRELRAAWAGGYLGPSPMDEQLDENDEAWYELALQNEYKRRAAEGLDKRLIKAAIAGGYRGPSPLDGPLLRSDQIAFDVCVRADMRRRANEGVCRLAVMDAQAAGYSGPHPAEATLSKRQMADFQAARSVGWSNRNVQAHFPDYSGPWWQLGQQQPAAFQAVARLVHTNVMAAQGQYHGSPLQPGEVSNLERDEAIRRRVREMASGTRRERRPDALPATNSGGWYHPDDPKVAHQCHRCYARHDHKTLDSKTGLPAPCGNARHFKCPQAVAHPGLGSSSCWGGKACRKKGRPGCPGCWVFGLDVTTAPPPAEAAVALREAHAIAITSLVAAEYSASTATDASDRLAWDSTCASAAVLVEALRKASECMEAEAAGTRAIA